MMPELDHKLDLSLETVVFATDFSLTSENAGLYAARLAAFFSARLLVAHAFTVSQAAMEVEAEKGLPSEQRRDLQSLLAGKASQLASDAVKAVPVLLDGDPKEAVPALAEEQAPSLIVLGTHGGGRLMRGIIGSVAEQILRSTRWPSLTVGPNVPPASSANFPFPRILFATDFTSSAAKAAAYAVFFSEALGASMDVLNVIHEDDAKDSARLSDLRRRFFTVLDGLVPQQARDFCDPSTFVAVGSAHHRILEHIRNRSIDLLVLGLRKTSHLGMEMRTSGAFRLIVEAPCPVLTLRR